MLEGCVYALKEVRSVGPSEGGVVAVIGRDTEVLLGVGDEGSLSDNLYGIGNVILGVVIVEEFETECADGAIGGTKGLFSEDPDVASSQKALALGRLEDVGGVLGLSKEEEDATVKGTLDVGQVVIDIDDTLFKLDALLDLQQDQPVRHLL